MTTEDSAQRLGLLGSGQLYQSVYRHLSQLAPVMTIERRDLLDKDELSLCSLLVVVADKRKPDLYNQINRYSLQSHVPWIGVYSEFGRAIVGPLVVPGQSGCATCADSRRTAAQKDVDAFVLLQKLLANSKPGAIAPVSWLSGFAIEVIANLLVYDIARFLKRMDGVQTLDALLSIDLATLAVHRHPFVSDPHCPDCGSLPDDTAERAIIKLQSRTKLGPFNYRVRALTSEKEQLQRCYVDAETGMISALVKDSYNLYSTFYAAINLQDGHRKETGVGRTFNFEQSSVGAIAEALERYGGMRPGGKRTVVRASYAEQADRALDPRTLGLYPPERYAMPGFPFVAYSSDLVCNWVWGYSFQQQRPLLVPERCVFYGLDYWRKDPPFVYEISNGCAIGGCLEEAILHGILELAERDAFLLTWYARMEVPRVDIATASDPLIPLMLERIYHLTGYTVHAFNITMEQGIPCFWVMGVDEQERPGMPRALCAAGSHLHPEKALINAIQELASVIRYHMTSYTAERRRALQMLAHSATVQQMSDHAHLYCLPEAFERLAFLYHTPRQQTFQEAFAPAVSAERNATLDLYVDLKEVMNRYLGMGMDIIVVDQTTPEQLLESFRCVKVIIPGLLPMTFGHEARRTDGLERLYRIPYQLGYAKNVLTSDDINPYPHPFP